MRLLLHLCDRLYNSLIGLNLGSLGLLFGLSFKVLTIIPWVLNAEEPEALSIWGGSLFTSVAFRLFTRWAIKMARQLTEMVRLLTSLVRELA